MEHADREQIWVSYEQTGSMRRTAEVLGLPYSRVRRTIQGDIIRLHDTQLSRMEQMAQEWADHEAMCLEANRAIIRMVMGVVSHVEQALETGKLTELRDPNARKFRIASCTEGVYEYEHVDTRMNAYEALQWIINQKLADVIARAGYSAAKVAETMRQLMMQGMSGTRQLAANEREADEYTPDELREMIETLESQGVVVPAQLKMLCEAAQEAQH